MERNTLLEVREQIIPAPLLGIFLLPLASDQIPSVVILSRAAIKDHAVDGGTAAHDAAGGHGARAVVQARLRHGGDVVVAGGAWHLVAFGLVANGGADGRYGGRGVEVAVLEDKDGGYGHDSHYTTDFLTRWD